MGIYCDNFEFKIVAHGEEALRLTLDLLGLANSYITHWAQDPFVSGTGKLTNQSRLILFWTDPGVIPRGSLQPTIKANPVGYKAKMSQMWTFIQGWLNEQDYGEQPDHDGSNSKGWRIESTRHGTYGHYAAVIITPEWAEHGK